MIYHFLRQKFMQNNIFKKINDKQKCCMFKEKNKRNKKKTLSNLDSAEVYLHSLTKE